MCADRSAVGWARGQCARPWFMKEMVPRRKVRRLARRSWMRGIRRR